MSLRENQADAKQTFGFLGSLTSKYPAKQDEDQEEKQMSNHTLLEIKDMMARAGIERLKGLIEDEAFTAMIDEELGGDSI